jgi:D-alanyl-D-alanine carboxypeptidase/D-alanyl-D-alanine-endopeptidase (penicillin-binding protein 4)
VATFNASRRVVEGWWKERWPDVAGPTLENGAGLSRKERITAQALGQMLQTAYLSPVMPELMSSLPIAGLDGTLRRSKAYAGQGAAHLKTGSLRDVTAVAGYVLGASGKRYVLIAITNHATLANAARPVYDALIDWVAKDQ